MAEPPTRRSTISRLPVSAESSARISGQAGLREVMARFATGVTVLTAPGERGHGMTANAFTSVSLEPPLVLCCVSRAARMHEAIVSANSFAVSILGSGQEATARYFADWRRPRGQAQFEQVDCTPGPRTGAPLLDGALAWLECALTEVHAGGDHSIFVGEVLHAGRGAAGEALLFNNGRFERTGARGTGDRRATG
ncbi:flavin reductase family protein [Saccharopolyspora indica]|uniref:flavin reductase family protein n=1 Tax=Saccharopolyspora indica TaxID=1229659 RepID=UPI0022EA3A34|nr:flavin reductase family protein [Saccharopolyspora indica]MDA3646998.1 flavin reductase family protein [Saccharopolyspora indica]